MYKQICSPMIGVTSCAALAGDVLKFIILRSVLLTFPKWQPPTDGTATYLKAQSVVFEYISS